MDRPLPIPCDLDQPFWDAAKAGRLLLQRAPSGRVQAYPRAHALDAPMDPGAAPEWFEATGRGVVETFSVVHRSFYPAIPAPYVFAVVRLDDGPLLTAHIVDCDPLTVRIGMNVEVVFVRLGDDMALPCVRPASAGGQP